MSRPSRFLFVIAPLVLGLVVGGCAEEPPSPVAAVKVERSHMLASAPPPTLFTIVPASRAQSADPAFQVAANLVAAQLERLGHRRIVGDGAARAAWKISLETSISAGGATAGSGLTYGFGWGQPPLRVLGGGQEVTSASAQAGAASSVEKRLAVTISADGKTVYQGRAVLFDPSRDLVAALSPLSRRLLDDFPGPLGAQGQSR
ncbi:hypothetical protein [Pararhodospirillum photometricum]|nr:hypothetical protein [Pararhodospirillum photometricum]